MNETTPTPDPARAVRIMHFALVAGCVLAAGVFVFMVQFRGFAVSVPPAVASILALVSVALLAFAVAVLRPRFPTRRSDEASEAYWAAPENRGSAIVLWAVTEGAALFGLVGYLLTGRLMPAVGAALAIAALAVFRPSYLEGAA